MTNIAIGPIRAANPIKVGTGASQSATPVATNRPLSPAQPVIIAPPGPKGDKGDPGVDGDDGIMAIYSLPLAP